MSIQDIIVQDIFNPSNKDDLLFAMNDRCVELTPSIAPFLIKLQYSLKKPLTLGSVMSVKAGENKRIHFLICHKNGKGGWIRADEYIRLGMDYLYQNKEAGQQFSGVLFGTGPIGKRDGANFPSIMIAVATSYLPVTLYVKPKTLAAAAVAIKTPLSLVAYAAWLPRAKRYEKIPVYA